MHCIKGLSKDDIQNWWFAHLKLPVISVNNAHLDLLRNDYAGLLQTQLTIVVTAKNGNARAHATFTDINFNISYQGQDITVLVADPFEVPKNSSEDLGYVVQSSSIPLRLDQMEQVDNAWKKNEIEFCTYFLSKNEIEFCTYFLPFL
ncbi:uncharacterized protein LOC106778924 [Vigna radiata var. radiata]|uniref:Uncharacterized protein LOC106778924 n=1 Tax=Vigna radiata var. radiata TaxID=3916 RepID=A0A1S3VWI5_VIGRR|nr:uncharacterized protein LOC106778924 [Vigna radiata var. radiata]